MSEVDALLSPEEETEVVRAIREAERQTSGEIRVHLEYTAQGDPMERAREVFLALKMENTRERNGVLIYVAARDHRFAIIGDKGIDKAVPAGFWDSTRDAMQNHFRNGRFAEGLIAGIRSAGRELKTHFPWKPDDTNELSNEISKG
ncbi:MULTISPECIES: TPM domain-containing protein [unclassified Robiginitalea]|uniref:TPM domain-containing protein n=1 Tax=Robiginitalea TaxID=252306 RepID=UPI00234B41AB|nr:MULTISPECIES: TPM domain-containing protein [unclassified Robiginitalea]MDC6355635.1 TPM domain-containing protein [Robiginitalea sp. PM2]MDC6376046.1 TPM domain-containing protein [Robiginitalea sp. SP8]